MQPLTEYSLAEVRARFTENFASRGELGAAVSIWHEGREVLALSGGWRDRQHAVPWTEVTLVLLWSITKGLAAACLLHVLAADGIGLETSVAALWPEFAARGKAAITLAELLSHRAALMALEDPAASIFDHAAVAAALAAQSPVHAPDASHGYHARTYGFLLDELVRRLRGGQPLGSYWRAQFGEPLGLDLWIGLPEDQDSRVAAVYPARMLGKFYAMLANGGVMDGRTFFRPAELAAMSTPLTTGPDAVLCLETAFSAGFMMDPLDVAGRKLRRRFGPSLRAFGQPGAGGGHAFADPENRIAFAYLMNQMELGVLPNAKSLGLVSAIYGL
jgi:CubicO group peptidase (beta-lactamase class C family)